VNGILDEMVGLVAAAGATKVLDLGCGTGWFAERLASAHPEIDYTGIDISIPQIQTAQSNAGAMGFNTPPVFQVGNTWEFLRFTDPIDWDFIVSSRHVFWDSDERNDLLMLELLFTRTAKGVLILGDKERITRLPLARFTRLSSNFTNLSASYHDPSGARAFLTDATLANASQEAMSPILFTADGVTEVKDPPVLYAHLQFINKGDYNRKLAADKIRKDVKDQNTKSTEVQGITFNSKGLVSLVGTKTIGTLKKPLTSRQLDPKLVKGSNQ
jgi:SAM-dependent methyltransferase